MYQRPSRVVRRRWHSDTDPGDRRRDGQTARATRLFDARRSVYVEVMNYVYRIEDYVNRTDPNVTFTGAPPPPTFPPEEEQRLQSAAVAAFGSPAIRAKLMDIKKSANVFQAADFVMHSFRRSHGEHSNEALQQWTVVEQKRLALRAHVLELTELVNDDLAR